MNISAVLVIVLPWALAMPWNLTFMMPLSWRTCFIVHSVPKLYMSETSGSSTMTSFWVTTQIIDWYCSLALLRAFTLFLLPTSITISCSGKMMTPLVQITGKSALLYISEYKLITSRSFQGRTCRMVDGKRNYFFNASRVFLILRSSDK